mmetsp:Transcript_7045/g.15274  ORF Transcript_7045/g.15274 Transcript_7045/m.15274 type:complete len:148 (+) Transcript_7045:273-716(+)
MNSNRTIGRRCPTRSRRRAMLLCITRISIIPTCIATSSWTCILDSVTVENITLNDVANNEQSGPLFVRHLRSSNSAGGKNNNDAVTVLPQGYYARRRYRLDENNNNNNNNNNVVYKRHDNNFYKLWGTPFPPSSSNHLPPPASRNRR